VLVTEGCIDALGVEAHRLGKIGHGSAFKAAFPKEQHHSLKRRILSKLIGRPVFPLPVFITLLAIL